MKKTICTVTLNPAFDLHYQMEKLEIHKENYVQAVRCDAGGKGINTSRALTVNGVENTAYVILGEENGASFEAALRKDGIRYLPLYTPGRIRENMTLHPAGDKETRISLDTFSVTPALLEALEHQLEPLLTEGCLISFSGRIPRGVEKNTVIAFLKRLIDAGASVIVDSGSLTPEDLRKIHPWFIKPNEQEIVAFLGREIRSFFDAADAAKKLVTQGVAREVMISLGGEGAVWSDGTRALILQVPRLEHPVSTIGAGDSTLAGLLAGCAKGLSKEECLAFAVSYGTAACMTEGTLPPRPEDIQEVLKQVRVTEA